MDTTLTDPLVGRLVDGRYLVQARIARGGMATVYRALDRRLDREVALKVMHEHLAGDEEFVARFVREARAAARLSHPNVVAVYDQGSDTSTAGPGLPNGDAAPLNGPPLLYLAMEYLPGRTLRDVLAQRGALTPRETLSVLEPVLDALAAAHRSGIVHRDIKPENVILTDDGRIKVADFGLARAITAPSAATGTGQLIGTAAYLAPELVSRGVADARADVYAAGIVLFEMLTGKQPFTGDDPLRVAYRHVHEDVPAPSAIGDRVTSAFDALVESATNRDPERRLPDAAVMLAGLHAVRDEMPAEVLDIRSAEAPALRTAPLQLGSTGALANGLPGSLRPRADTLTSRDTPTAHTPAVAPNGLAPAAAGVPQATRTLNVPPRQDPPLVPRLRVHEDDEDLGVGTEFLAGRRRRGMIALITAGVLAIGLAVGGWWFSSGPGSYIDAPEVVGQRVSEARRTLSASGLDAKVEEAFNAKIPQGRVIDSDPAAGENVKKDGTVTLVVSKGPELVAVPALKDKTPDEARGLLEKEGLKLGEQSEKFSGSVEKGKIISSSPESGQKIPAGRTVNVTVSRGAQQVQVPNLQNQPLDAAKQQLEALGLVPQVTESDWYDGAPADGVVISQTPAPDTTVAKGTTVTLIAIKAQPGTEGQIPVPDVLGKPYDQARQELRDAGFKVRRQSFGFGDTVRQQSVTGTALPDTVIVLRTAL